MTVPHVPERWTPGPIWEGETAVIIGSGPSLTKQDRDYTQGKARVVALNREWFWTPWADMLYACDGKYFFTQDDQPHGGKAAYKHFGGLIVTQDFRAAADLPNLKWVEISPPGIKNMADLSGYDDRPGYIRSGKGSCYQTMNLLGHLGVKRILLLGIDMKFAPDGRQHHYSEPPRGLAISAIERMRTFFDSIAGHLEARGIEVINCSPDSAVEAFPKARIYEVL